MTFEQRYYDTVEASKLLNVSLNTMRNYIHAGQIKATKFSRVWKIEGSELERFVNEGTSKNYWKNYNGTQKKKEG